MDLGTPSFSRSSANSPSLSMMNYSSNSNSPIPTCVPQQSHVKPATMQQAGSVQTPPSLTAAQLHNLQSIIHKAHPQSKYAELLAVIEDMGRDMRPTYAGSKSSTERLKRGIVHARALVRECLAEAERSSRM